MTDHSPDADPYVAERVRQALAGDPRVGELGVVVEIAGETVMLRGTLASIERQQAATEVVRDLLPHHRVRNETTVVNLPESPRVEHLP